VDFGDFGGDHVTEGVGSVIAAQTFVVGVGFEDVGRIIGIMLKVGQAGSFSQHAPRQRFRGNTGRQRAVSGRPAIPVRENR